MSDTPFIFDEKCMLAFENLKKKLSSAPIITPPDWNLPFQLMCDASDFAVGEFNIEIRDKKGVENKVADHISRIPCEKDATHDTSVNEFFPDEQLMLVHKAPWFADIANFKAVGAFQKKRDERSYGIAMVLAMEVILEEKESQRRCCNVGSSGLLSSRMLRNW
ncbi:uncharacterized protein LOC107489444 [Arachis duranensis]|uniref:Uncharacterized protein LOC107489444 n=1 Tax=Arachis duranensis TaxID=130453 RepID=A0A6P5NTF2_ARADU|nr:uncharacterized protein LOC107489444 [Arachis duranensis]